MKTLFNKHRPLFIGAFVILFVALWALFRPDLLFVKKPVDDPFPGSTSFISSTVYVANATAPKSLLLL